ncbi:hypothetical protein [Pseudomonas syringae]|uniref:Uncharacterized protein n=1 Tax=Pseudomonas syringae pv. papulans TaxID=83963 RepID=A0A0P9X6M8_PSESX|nr:hypothetical protein [Pseudomonas syringae]KPY29756.1 Unknown protein sequence [Pseudomonas syringae pv. papulans]KWS41962.1 hypothetical protein AL059_19680 [Pseudomonas syringae pv. papulans]MDH4602850.1 hypothetical protein [Pseudomonas syringae pv. papulans]MDH4621463.1 hypothetical protein [Pseudomonas syringae pv. papulans]RMN43684.1 hypothetical protein ALQ60_03836 [Pseudomonas syringae pv. papulans]
MQLAILVVLILIAVILAPWLIGVIALAAAAYGVWLIVAAAAGVIAIAVVLLVVAVRGGLRPSASKLSARMEEQIAESNRLHHAKEAAKRATGSKE